MIKNFRRKLAVTLITGTAIALVSIPALAQENTQPQPETTPMPPTTPAPEPAQNPEPQPAPEPAAQPAPQPAPTVVYAPVATVPTAATSPYSNLRRQPKKLRPIDGKEPPMGYVEVERKRKGLIISGAAIFGGTYLLCLGLSTEERPLVIPVVGPVIAGFQHEADYSDLMGDEQWAQDQAEDEEYRAKLFGVLGTVAQTTGIVLFVAGMLSKKKMWLRQDIAGVKFQFTPTVVGNADPGLGVVGTF